MSKPNTLEEALLRIEELEDALSEFAPFAACEDVDIMASFPGNSAPETIQSFKRDTLYCDLSMFRRAAELTTHRK